MKRLYTTSVGVGLLAAFACGGHSSVLQPTSLESTRLTSQAPLPSGSADDPGAFVGVLAGAGDIALCGSGNVGAKSTARLLDQISGTLFTAGDNAYFSGSTREFQDCYGPTWGRHRERTRPSPGNHEYDSGGSGYYTYFGSNAGPAGLGYYSYDIGSWRVFSLNSEVPSGPGSAQGEWLRNELSRDRASCTLAYWHRPLFSSGKIGDNADMRDLWRTLYTANVDVVINGHDHLYERFAPQDPEGRPDPVHGIREFIVGTGGAPLSGISVVKANSQTRATVWGVAVFTLYDHGYEWRFVPSTEEFDDTGSSTCH